MSSALAPGFNEKIDLVGMMVMLEVVMVLAGHSQNASRPLVNTAVFRHPLDRVELWMMPIAYVLDSIPTDSGLAV